MTYTAREMFLYAGESVIAYFPHDAELCKLVAELLNETEKENPLEEEIP